MASRDSSPRHPATSMNTPSTRPHRSSPLNPNSQSNNATLSAPTAGTPAATASAADPASASASAAPKATPYRTLLQISKPTTPTTSTTPRRRASSAGPSTTSRPVARTPVAARTPSARLGGSARRPGTAMTPHGRAALREVEARRAGFTPGPADRRRSGRQQRDTPRDDLRALSRMLAPKTKPTVPSPDPEEEEEGRGKGKARIVTLPPRRGEDSDDDDEPLPRPRFSLPMGDDDDEDDSLLEPPRSSGLEDDNITVRSVELARRAALGRGPSRLSRGSFGSVGLGDQFGELNESGLDGVGGVFDSSFAMGGPYPDDDDVLDDADDGFQADTTVTSTRARLSLAESDIRPGTLADDTENTFVFTVPPRDVPDLQRSDDTVESPPRADDENNAWDDMDLDAGGLPSGDEGEAGWTGVLDADAEPTDVLDPSAETTTIQTHAASRKKNKRVKVSKHGIPYPSLPAGVVKKLATRYARASGNSKAKISKDALDAIVQASDWFFEQVSDDLGAYAGHAGRKTIEESDVVTLMGRQRQINAGTTPFSLAQRFLPRELLQELRMAPPAKLKRGRQLERMDEADEDEE